MTGGPNGFPVFALQFDASLIPALASRYSYPPEGQAVDEIGPAVRERGYFTRPELIEVCAWKTARSRSRVAANTDEEVRETTRLALSATAEALRIWIPMALSGVRWPHGLRAAAFRAPGSLSDPGLPGAGGTRGYRARELHGAFLECLRRRVPPDR
jgi:hypothetical protein